MEAENTYVKSSTFTNINNQAYTDGYKQTAALFDFYIRETYSSITEYVYLDTVTVNYFYGGSGGRFMNAIWNTHTSYTNPGTSTY